MPEQKKYTSEKKEEWCKKLGLSSKMDINVVQRYSHLGEQLLRTTYNALSVKLTVSLQVCGGFARYKAKACAVRKKTYAIASNPGEMIFVHTAGPLLESLIGNRYGIGVVDNYSRYF